MAWKGIDYDYKVSVSMATDYISLDNFNDMANFRIPNIVCNDKAVKDLQEYLGDFLDDIKANLNIRIHPTRDYISVYMTMCDGPDVYMDKGFSFQLPMGVIDKWDVPHFGNYIFEMWNAYVMAFVDEDIELIVQTRDFEGKPRFIFEEEDDEEDVNVLFRSMPWIVPEEEE